MPKEAIERIINERNRKSALYVQKKMSYEDINRKVNDIIREKEAIVRLYEENKSAEGMEILGKFVDSISTIDKSDYIEKYKKLEKSIDELVQRYSKDEVNISVVGRRRQGKSLLLQSISGLDSNIIPAADSTDCTGAVSVIHNQGGMKGVNVKVFFYTKEEIIDTVNQYILALTDGSVQKIFTMTEIKDLNLVDLGQSIAEREDPRLSSLFEKLQKYVDHYDEWSKYVEYYDGVSEAYRFLELNDSEEIIKFVAQHNGKIGTEKEEYYRYLSVKLADITCEFNFERAGKIVLRDTIGLGDMRAINLDKAMVQSVTEKCDAAIIVKRPIEGTGDYAPEDAEIYSILKESCDRRAFDMNKWFFYAINNVDKHGDGGNIRDCERVVSQIAEKHVACAQAYIVNVSKPDEVTEKLLKPMLFKLMENLPDLDRDLEERIEREEAELIDAYNTFRQQCIRASSLDVNIKTRQISRTEAEDKWAQLRLAIYEIEASYKANKDESCESFKKCIDDLEPVYEEESELIPSRTQILQALRLGTTAHDYIEKGMNKLRIDFTKKFIEINDVLSELVCHMKKLVCDKLISIAGFDKVANTTPEEYKKELEKNPKYTKGSEYSDWLSLLARSLNSMFADDIKRYEDIVTAIEFLSDFNISVRGFIMQKVRDNLELIDPDVTKWPIQHMLAVESGMSKEQLSVEIHSILTRLYSDTYKILYQNIEHMFHEPNGLLYAAIAEFSDRMVESIIETSENELKSIETTWLELFQTNDVFQRGLIEATNKCIALKEKFISLAAK